MTISIEWFRFIKGALRSGPGLNNDEEMLEYPNSPFARTSVPYNGPHYFWNFPRAQSLKPGAKSREKAKHNLPRPARLRAQRIRY